MSQRNISDNRMHTPRWRQSGAQSDFKLTWLPNGHCITTMRATDTFKDPGNRRLSMTRTQGSIGSIGSEEDFAADFNDDDDDMGAQRADVFANNKLTATRMPSIFKESVVHHDFTEPESKFFLSDTHRFSRQNSGSCLTATGNLSRENPFSMTGISLMNPNRSKRRSTSSRSLTSPSFASPTPFGRTTTFRMPALQPI